MFHFNCGKFLQITDTNMLKVYAVITDW